MNRGACAGLAGRLGGIIFALAAAFRLRLNSKRSATPASNAPDNTAMPAMSRKLSGELAVEVPVFVFPLLPEFVPLVVGVWPFPTVGDTPAVGDAVVTVALVLVVGVAAGVVVVVGVTAGVVVGDGRGVGEGDTPGAA